MNLRAALLFRWSAWLAGLAVLAMVLLYLLRLPLAAAALASALKMAGAGDVRLAVTEASPWQVVVENLDFRYRAQRFEAQRVTLGRAHWWQASLGHVAVTGARVPVTIDGSDTNPWSWATYSGKPATIAAGDLQVPAERISIDGEVIVKAGALPDQALAVKFDATQGLGGLWTGNVQATGPGLRLQGEMVYDLPKNALRYRVPAVDLELKAWEGFVQRLTLLPGGYWGIEGRIKGSVEGAYADEKLTAAGTISYREGRLNLPERKLAAEGVEADFEFTDFDKIRSKPGTVRVRELRSGDFTVTDIEAGLEFQGLEKIIVHRASLRALGGTLAAEPFVFRLNQSELEATLLVDGLDVAQALALAKDIPAQATGRVDGRLPIRIDSGGLRLGTGWLALKAGVHAEVQFKAAGLLTGGVPANNPSFPILQKIESGLLRLKVGELRLDVRPPDAPAGRSARLHVAGEPVDPTVKAPVVLDLNVNGPIEQLLNLGMNQKLKFGSGR